MIANTLLSKIMAWVLTLVMLFATGSAIPFVSFNDEAYDDLEITEDVDDTDDIGPLENEEETPEDEESLDDPAEEPGTESDVEDGPDEPDEEDTGDDPADDDSEQPDKRRGKPHSGRGNSGEKRGEKPRSEDPDETPESEPGDDSDFDDAPIDDSETGAVEYIEPTVIYIKDIDPLPFDVAVQEYAHGDVKTLDDINLPGELPATDTEGRPVTIKGITWQLTYCGVCEDSVCHDLFHPGLFSGSADGPSPIMPGFGFQSPADAFGFDVVSATNNNSILYYFQVSGAGLPPGYQSDNENHIYNYDNYDYLSWITFDISVTISNSNGMSMQFAPIMPSAHYDTNTINLSDNSIVGGDTGNGWNYTAERNVAGFFQPGYYTILDGANVIVTGDNNTNWRRVEVEQDATATVTLRGATIIGFETGEGDENSPPFKLNRDSNVILKIENNGAVINTLAGGSGQAAIHIADSNAYYATIRIEGTGTLDATSGTLAAAIGGKNNAQSGDITIALDAGGKIIAKSQDLAAAIGGGYLGNCNSIDIISGIIDARSTTAPAIGCGTGGSGGAITINNAVIDATSTSNVSIGGNATTRLILNGDAVVYAPNGVNVAPTGTGTTNSHYTKGIICSGSVYQMYGDVAPKQNFDFKASTTFPNLNGQLTINNGIEMINRSNVAIPGSIYIMNGGKLYNNNRMTISTGDVLIMEGAELINAAGSASGGTIIIDRTNATSYGSLYHYGTLTNNNRVGGGTGTAPAWMDPAAPPTTFPSLTPTLFAPSYGIINRGIYYEAFDIDDRTPPETGDYNLSPGRAPRDLNYQNPADSNIIHNQGTFHPVYDIFSYTAGDTQTNYIGQRITPTNVIDLSIPAEQVLLKGKGWSFDKAAGIYTITGNVTVIGTNNVTGHTVKVASSATVTLGGKNEEGVDKSYKAMEMVKAGVGNTIYIADGVSVNIILSVDTDTGTQTVHTIKDGISGGSAVSISGTGALSTTDITSGSVTISSGTVTASGNITALDGDVKISGGSVTATGSISADDGGIDISGGTTSANNISASTGDITISGGTVTTTGNISASDGDISISGSSIVTTAGNITASDGDISISGGTVTVYGDIVSQEGDITIESSTVTVGTVLSNGSIKAEEGSVTIKSGTVDIKGGISADDTILISSGTVTVINGSGAAGLSAEQITINGGAVIAEGFTYGISGTFSMGTTSPAVTSSAIVFASGVSAMPTPANGGILVIRSDKSNAGTHWYDTTSEFTAPGNTTIPASRPAVPPSNDPIGYTLTIDKGKTFTIGAGTKLTNGGTIIALDSTSPPPAIPPYSGGVLNIAGTIENNGKVTPGDGSSINLGTRTGTPLFDGANVSKPEIDDPDAAALDLLPVDLLAATGQSVEYAHGSSSTPPSAGWSTTVPTGVVPTGSPGDKYYFFARSQANANYNAGAVKSIEFSTPNYDWSVDYTSLDFKNLPYLEPANPALAPAGDTQKVTITNTGNRPIYITGIVLTSDSGPIAAEAFTYTVNGAAVPSPISIPVAADGGTATIEITPKSGTSYPEFTRGVYLQTLSVTATPQMSENNALKNPIKISLRREVGLAKGSDIAPAPSGSATDADTIEVIAPFPALDKADYGQSIEYAVVEVAGASATAPPAPATGWQASTTFTGLKEYSYYFIYARSTAVDDLCTAGDAVPGAAPVLTPDVTPPTAEIAIRSRVFESFINTITFGLFYRDNPLTVTVTGRDTSVTSANGKNSGIARIEYIKSDVRYTSWSGAGGLQSAIGVTETWVDITGTVASPPPATLTRTFTIPPNFKGYIYAKVTDAYGNERVICSDGLVLYTNTVPVKTDLTYFKDSASAAGRTITVDLNENTINTVMLGNAILTSPAHYAASANPQNAAHTDIVFAAGYFDSLAPGDYTFKITYNPYGISYVDAEGNDAPAETTITVRIKQYITIDGADITYHGKVYDGTTAVTGAVTITPSGVNAAHTITISYTSATFSDPNAGDQDVTFNGLARSGAHGIYYELTSTSATKTGVTIVKATQENITGPALTYLAGIAAPQPAQAVDIAAYLPVLQPPLSFGATPPLAYTASHSGMVAAAPADGADVTPPLPLDITVNANLAIGARDTLKVTVSSRNFEDFDILINIEAVELVVRAEGTIKGVAGFPLESPQDICITLDGDTFVPAFNDAISSAGWITNLPAGLTQAVTRVDGTTVKITVDGTPDDSLSYPIYGTMDITVPDGAMTINPLAWPVAAKYNTTGYDLQEPRFWAEVTPSSHIFVGRGSDQEFTITNTGNMTLTGLSASFGLGADTYFEIISGLSGLTDPLLPGQARVFTIRPDQNLIPAEYVDILSVNWDNNNMDDSEALQINLSYILPKNYPRITWPLYGTITYGQTLDNAVFTGGTGDGYFQFYNRRVILQVSDSGVLYRVDFYPKDMVYYQWISDYIPVMIEPKPITIEDVTAITRSYNGTDIVSLSGGRLEGVLEKDLDDIGFILGTGTVDTPDAGTGKPVEVNIQLTGEAAENYVLVQPEYITATITRSALTISDVKAVDRIYNGTTAVELTGGVLRGVFPADAGDAGRLGFRLGTGTSSSPDAGGPWDVSAGVTLTGTSAINYTLAQPDYITVSIGRAPLTVSGFNIVKPYDGYNTVRSDYLSNLYFAGLQNGETAVVDTSQAGVPVYDNEHPGERKTITFSGVFDMLPGAGTANPGNYYIVNPNWTTGVINHGFEPIRGIHYTSPAWGAHNGWTSGEYTIAALPGYLISRTNTAEGDWIESLSYNRETGIYGANFRFYMKNIETGEISILATRGFKIDNTPPEATIKYAMGVFRQFMNTISFGLLYEDSVDITIEAYDALSGVLSVEYFKARGELTEFDNVEWVAGNGFMNTQDSNSVTFTAVAVDEFILYSRIIDLAGNYAILLDSGVVVEEGVIEQPPEEPVDEPPVVLPADPPPPAPGPSVMDENTGLMWWQWFLFILPFLLFLLLLLILLYLWHKERQRRRRRMLEEQKRLGANP